MFIAGMKRLSAKSGQPEPKREVRESISERQCESVVTTAPFPLLLDTI